MWDADLPSDPGTYTEVTGRVVAVNGQLLVVLPFRVPTGANRGRRYRIEHDGAAGSSVVYSFDGCAALSLPDRTPLTVNETVTFRVRALPQRRMPRVPTDLAAALSTAGVTLADLSEPEVRHLLSMVQEAHDPESEVRRARVSHAVNVARQASGGER
ncbi:hypothetical protein ACWDUL_33720 [Nocardia niigatensis]